MREALRRPLLATLLVLSSLLPRCSGEGGPPSGAINGGPRSPAASPEALPFPVDRPDEGVPLTDEEIVAFTERIIGAWRDVRFFDYLDAVTYGYPRGNAQGMPHYGVFWTGVAPYKHRDFITFRHLAGGSAENIMIPNPVLLTNVMAAYLFSGDERLALLADELARGVSAQFMGCVWDNNVPEEDRHVMARAVINNNYESTLPDGRAFGVDYSAWRMVDMTRWNTHFMNVPNNPYWGDIYLQNMRSKDDVCHLFRAAGLIEHLLPGFAGTLAEDGVNGAYADLKAFATDIVDHGFRIRSLDHGGDIFIPAIDLASFVFYGPVAECDATLAAQIFAYEEPGGIDCGNGVTGWYEVIATLLHGFNYDIIRNYHMAALLHSLNRGQDDVAERLMQGLIYRSNSDMAKTDGHIEDPVEQEKYNGKLAGTLVKYAACGLPLTSREVRFVHAWFDRAIEVWRAWPYWNLWDDALPEGRLPYHPSTRVSFQDMTAFLQMCASPYYNDTLAVPVDCDMIRDASLWLD